MCDRYWTWQSFNPTSAVHTASTAAAGAHRPNRRQHDSRSKWLLVDNLNRSASQASKHGTACFHAHNPTSPKGDSHMRLASSALRLQSSPREKRGIHNRNRHYWPQKSEIKSIVRPPCRHTITCPPQDHYTLAVSTALRLQSFILPSTHRL